MTLDKMTVDKISENKMSVDEISLNNMSVYQLNVESGFWKDSCRQKT